MQSGVYSIPFTCDSLSNRGDISKVRVEDTMQFIATAIPGVLILEPKVFGDERGFFMETYQAQLFAEAGIHYNFVQDNHSGSRQGILRGLHYQIRQSQAKLVRVVAGEIFDVAVDIRRSSPTFGQWVGVHLSAQNKRQVWVPVGFAHGFYVLSEWAEFLYKVSDFYAPQWERTLIWNDPRLNIAWPLVDGKPPSLSQKDAQGLPLDQIECFE
jgi:dTDP-4-dehydrorhamnose 3,5-epimerase